MRAFSRVSVSVEMCEISGAIKIRSKAVTAAVQINYNFDLALDNMIIREILGA